jgi:hypothetical protein
VAPAARSLNAICLADPRHRHGHDSG